MENEHVIFHLEPATKNEDGKKNLVSSRRYNFYSTTIISGANSTNTKRERFEQKRVKNWNDAASVAITTGGGGGEYYVILTIVIPKDKISPKSEGGGPV